MLKEQHCESDCQ